jgi:tryptophanyl-tRNA synthetase
VAREQDLNPLLPDGSRKRILTGDRTTGKLHLGHYIGSLKNRVRLQSQYDTFILLADVQALTTHYDRPEVLKQSVIDVALDYLAVGLVPYEGGDDDGSKAKFVIQSMVPAIAEMTVYYGILVPMSLVLDNPTTKAEAETMGLSRENDIASLRKLYEDVVDEFAELASEVAESIIKQFPEVGNIIELEVLYALDHISFAYNTSLREELSRISVATKYDDIAPTEMTFIENWKAKLEQLLRKYSHSVALQRELRNQLIAFKRQTGVRQETYGFLGYPVSQAADITFVGAHLVPVGEDQVPHIELTREIVRRFNNQYGETLVAPQALIGGGTVKGLDGSAKMSKSLDNAIYLSDSYDEIWRRISRAVTDPQRMRRNDPGRPEICNIFSYHELFNAETEPVIAAANLDVLSVPDTAEQCRSAGIGCVDCKKNLAAKLDALLAPMRERRAQWEARPDDLRELLQAGTARAAAEGEKTLAKVKQAMHVDYFAP